MLPVVVRYTRTQFTQTEQFLAVYGQHLAAVLASTESIHQHPWAWITSPLAFEQEDRVTHLLSEFIATARGANEICEHLHGAAGIDLTRTCRGLEHATYTLALLPSSGGALIEELMTPCQLPENRKSLSEFVGHVESFQSGLARLSASAGNVSALLDAEAARELSLALDCLDRWGLSGYSIAQVKTILRASTNTAKLLGEAQSSFRVLLMVIGCEAPATLSSATFLLETVRIIDATPFEMLHLRLPAFEHEHTRPILQTAQQEAAWLKAAESWLGADFDLTSAVAPGRGI
jgi:hypothetical protein